MRPVEIPRAQLVNRARLYNVYGGARVPYVPNIIKHNIYIANMQLVYVGLAQARPNYTGADSWLEAKQTRN